MIKCAKKKRTGRFWNCGSQREAGMLACCAKTACDPLAPSRLSRLQTVYQKDHKEVYERATKSLETCLRRVDPDQQHGRAAEQHAGHARPRPRSPGEDVVQVLRNEHDEAAPKREGNTQHLF